MKIETIFPIAITQVDLGRELTDFENHFISNQDLHQNQGNLTSVDHNILNDPKMINLKEFCQSSLEQYFESVYCPKEEISIYITQSWANYTERGGFHHKHFHPNSFISGVFYVESDAETDKIYFESGKYPAIDIAPRDWNLYNSKTWWMPAKAGSLILFPSSLTHYVENTVSAKRVSISFNTFLKGRLGNFVELSGLEL